MRNLTTGELGLLIENLTKTTDDGFVKTHQKQDTTNGNVTRNTNFRISQQTSNKWMYALITVVALPVFLLIIDKLT